ncbi:MAG: Gfo/Idh/MocA family oxidoreductase [Candidatus Latescibacteria bacterium]|nr:Gfo/Idh/MocA family oxidoreductase [Candidatus Latescibacterota bacterium]
MGTRATLLGDPNARSVLKPTLEGSIRIAVVGLGHRAVGNAIRKTVEYDDYDLVAVCDLRPELVEKVTGDLAREHHLNVRGYTDYDQMLQEERLDAVAIHIDADKQVPLACQAMEAGLHVMTEVPAACSIADCWRLVTTVERTGKVYLLMEQTRFWGFIRAWREIVQSGVIGRPIYVEGEYVGYYGTWQMFQDREGRFYTAEQSRGNPDARPTWRHQLQPITYLVHELSPLLYILEDRVERVVAMSTRPRSYRHPEIERADIQLALMHTEKDAVMKLARGSNTPVIHRGETSHHWFHIKGTEGALEWKRADWDKPKLWVAGWQLQEPIAVPWSTSRMDGPKTAAGSGHGDADFYVFAQFADAVLRNTPHELDVYRSVETAAPAILAAKSVLDDNRPQDVPDFRPGPHRRPGELPKEMS